jgi:hypothetical protein
MQFYHIIFFGFGIYIPERSSSVEIEGSYIPTERDSVKIVHLNKLPEKIASKKLGTRRVGAEGNIINACVPGFDSLAIEVMHLESFGERNGERAIYFPGEFMRIPDIPVRY